jgi:hypothetical protein
VTKRLFAKTLYHGTAREAHLLHMLNPTKNTFARGSRVSNLAKKKSNWTSKSFVLQGVLNKIFMDHALAPQKLL